MKKNCDMKWWILMFLVRLKLLFADRRPSAAWTLNSGLMQSLLFLLQDRTNAAKPCLTWGFVFWSFIARNNFHEFDLQRFTAFLWNMKCLGFILFYFNFTSTCSGIYSILFYHFSNELIWVGLWGYWATYVITFLKKTCVESVKFTSSIHLKSSTLPVTVCSCFALTNHIWLCLLN